MANIVIDTNILVSAFISSHISSPALCLDLVFAGKHQLILTKEILEEYKLVLSRPKFAIKPAIVRAFLKRLPGHSVVLIPKKQFRLCSDVDDNIFLDAAFAGKATYLITGNLRHFPQVVSFTSIVTAKQFINLQTTAEG